MANATKGTNAPATNLAAERAASKARKAAKAAPKGKAAPAAPVAPVAAPAVALTAGQAARLAGTTGACKWQWVRQPVVLACGTHTARTVYNVRQVAQGLVGHVVVANTEWAVQQAAGGTTWQVTGRKPKGQQAQYVGTPMQAAPASALPQAGA